MTALERLRQLSGLSGASAGDALRKIARASGLAGALLVGFSGLATGTAAEHLLSNGQQIPVTPTESTGSGGGVFSDPKLTTLFTETSTDDDLALQIQQEDEAIFMVIAQLMVNGAFA